MFLQFKEHCQMAQFAERAADDEAHGSSSVQDYVRSLCRLTFLRVYSGVLKIGSYILNSTKDQKERILD
jgi:elongation factor G